MSHVYEIAAKITTNAGAAAIGTIVTAASPRAEIREIGCFTTTAVAGEIGLGRPAANPTGALTGGITVLPTDSADAAGATILGPNNGSNTSWATTQPTAPTNFFRRVQLPGNIGAGFIWVWGQGELMVPVSSFLCVWQISVLAVTYDLYVKIIE
jgi:hypothetical protein